MNIILDHIMPVPLASIQHGADSIWGRRIELEQGRKIMLNASSGKGKSTFTHTLFGLRKDFSGQLLFDGQDTAAYGFEDWTKIRREGIAVLFQDLQLFPELTVRENLQLKNQLSQTYTEEELREQLDFLGIADKWDQACGLLSMGQQQRVAIIRSLIQKFDWLILDEPFSHLDRENASKCLEMINKRCDELRAGFVLTTLGDDYGFHYDQELKL
ncbi:MAG: ATP-binding cassette domain-containing protein [Bacteroidetes bacterium]|nr:MAG: ATP-binding cassette domain-containing protein [Bacteroidota bacterium]